MARIIFPDTFLKQSELFTLIYAKVTSDGPASPLLSYLLEQEIVLADDDADRLAAEVIEKNRLALEKESENYRQLRNNLFKPVKKRMRNYYQFLKKFYNTGYKSVGLWGAPITTTGRISYPSDFLHLTGIFEKLAEKYGTYPAGTSPLDPYLNKHGHSIAADQGIIGNATMQHNLAEAKARASEQATQSRNNIWNPVLEHMRGIGAFLLALYTGNPKELGYYGFVVDNSPRAPREIKSKVKLLGQKTMNGVIIGGIFKNTGTVPLTIHKGRNTSTAGTVVSAGETLGIPPKYSIITVFNPSSNTNGEFSILRSK